METKTNESSSFPRQVSEPKSEASSDSGIGKSHLKSEASADSGIGKSHLYKNDSSESETSVFQCDEKPQLKVNQFFHSQHNSSPLPKPRFCFSECGAINRGHGLRRVQSFSSTKSCDETSTDVHIGRQTSYDDFFIGLTANVKEPDIDNDFSQNSDRNSAASPLFRYKLTHQDSVDGSQEVFLQPRKDTLANVAVKTEIEGPVSVVKSSSFEPVYQTSCSSSESSNQHCSPTTHKELPETCDQVDLCLKSPFKHQPQPHSLNASNFGILDLLATQESYASDISENDLHLKSSYHHLKRSLSLQLSNPSAAEHKVLSQVGRELRYARVKCCNILKENKVLKNTLHEQQQRYLAFDQLVKENDRVSGHRLQSLIKAYQEKDALTTQVNALNGDMMTYKREYDKLGAEMRNEQHRNSTLEQQLNRERNENKLKQGKIQEMEYQICQSDIRTAETNQRCAQLENMLRNERELFDREVKRKEKQIRLQKIQAEELEANNRQLQEEVRLLKRYPPNRNNNMRSS